MNYLLEGQQSNRLHFRLLKNSDFKEWMKLFEAENVALFIGFNPNMSANQLCQLWFDKVFYRYKNNLGGMNVLIDKKTQKLIGQCGLLVQTVEGKEYLEIGYSILPEYWNQGYASEASQKCKEFAFENNLADTLISIVHKDNIQSEKVAIKNGMTLEKKINNYGGHPVNVFKIEKVNELDTSA